VSEVMHLKLRNTTRRLVINIERHALRKLQAKLNPVVFSTDLKSAVRKPKVSQKEIQKNKKQE
jgi:hypothetical protein